MKIPYKTNNISKNFASLYRSIFLKSKKGIDKKIQTFTSEEEIKNYLTNTLKNEIYKNEKEIRLEFEKVSCKNCGKCCLFTISEFSTDDLQKKALNGDKTAKSFLKVFVEYQQGEISLDTVHKDKCYIYRCNNVKKEGNKYLCPIYDKRPDVCRNFPDTPLENLPEGCAYSSWKENNEIKALFIKALNDIRKFYLNEL